MGNSREARRRRVTSVRPSVFFEPPDPLPRGRHSLTAEDVLAVQRERLLVSATELLNAYGYHAFRAADIAKRAGVSLAAFYRCFENKDDCVFAGYDRFIAILTQRLLDTDLTKLDRSGIIGALLLSYLSTLQADMTVARAYQTEMDALGALAREKRRDALRRLAQFIDHVVGREAARRGVTATTPPVTWIEAVIYGVRQMASDALDEYDTPDLKAIGVELQPWIDQMFSNIAVPPA